MKEVKIVIGANFGDEGKGLMTDYFCHQLASQDAVLNVRFNGGAQAGHTVQTPEGQRHVFKHIGSGQFVPGVSTYLSPYFIINPILFQEEQAALNSLQISPAVYADQNCLVSIPQDMMLNQMSESNRKKHSHGSCGVGIFETICRSRQKDCRITLADCTDTNRLRAKIHHILHVYLPARLALLGIKENQENLDLLQNQDIIEVYLEDVQQFLSSVTMTNVNILERHSQLVFEGAQGLLLDQHNLDYFPHLTPSSTGLANAAAMLGQLKEPCQVEACYVTRSYFTRHGAGPFPSQCEKGRINPHMVDRTNVTNEFQGTFRYGFFDLPLFEKTVRQDCSAHRKEFASFCASVSVTHLNETANNLACQGGPLSPDMLKNSGITQLYGSNGLTRQSVNKR